MSSMALAAPPPSPRSHSRQPTAAAGCGSDPPYVPAAGHAVRLRLDEYRVLPQRVTRPGRADRDRRAQHRRLTHNVAVVQFDRPLGEDEEKQYARTPTAHPGEVVRTRGDAQAGQVPPRLHDRQPRQPRASTASSRSRRRAERSKAAARRRTERCPPFGQTDVGPGRSSQRPSERPAPGWHPGSAPGAPLPGATAGAATPPRTCRSRPGTTRAARRPGPRPCA